MLLPSTSFPVRPRGSRVALAAVALAAALALVPSAAIAQSDDGDAPAVDCVPAPLDGTDSEPATGEAAPNLTEQLDACDGVLKPPPIGDSEFTEPAPPVGETPVIEPEDLPPQNSG
tara:strand:+ start:20007 stop:20354 length:348 start_codon:yes stop_codon:yes gene_type:complete